ncbi:SRPBCC family protein [Euzebya sp.]|uniref:SRPBCC family protein n=1 Tax=Euzebya sp. TaxID=1971409 RepID=UPI0035134DB4
MSQSDVSAHDGVLERTPTGGFIRFERRYPHPIEEVWDAITNPARLADWWVPFEADITLDLRPGGKMVMAGRGDDAPTMVWEVLAVDPPRLLEHTHADEGSRMRWELEPAGEGCVLRVSHHVPDPAVAIERNYLVGLHTSLSALGPTLDGRRASWDREEFERLRVRYAARGLGLADPAGGR